MNIKLITTLTAVALLTACAKAAPPVQQPPMIPIILVNIEKNVIAAVPDEPSTQKLVSIRKTDRADKALATTLGYTKDLKVYSDTVTEIATECKLELDDRDKRLNKIKQYILLQQPQTQPVQ